MARIITNNSQIKFQIEDEGKDVKDIKSGPSLEGPVPPFQNQYEQCPAHIGAEIEKRTQKLIQINKSLSEFLAIIE